MEIGFRKLGVPNLYINNMAYKPQEDITTYELAMLARLFMCAMAQNSGFQYDFEGYLIEHNLLRHFEKQEVE